MWGYTPRTAFAYYFLSRMRRRNRAAEQMTQFRSAFGEKTDKFKRQVEGLQEQ